MQILATLGKTAGMGEKSFLLTTASRNPIIHIRLWGGQSSPCFRWLPAGQDMRLLPPVNNQAVTPVSIPTKEM